MVEKDNNRTNVIWSFESPFLTDDVIAHIARSEVDGVRVVQATDELGELLEKTAKLRIALTEQDKMVPVLVDTVPAARGFVRKIVDPLELVFDQQLRLTPENGNGDIKVACKDWRGLFKDGIEIYFGSGSVVMTVETVGDDFAQARVVQGGQVHANVGIHCPETRQEVTLDSISVEDMQRLVAHNVDGLVIPGFASPEDLANFKASIKSISVSHPWLFLKVDSERIYQNLGEYLPYIKGVLVSRVDLAMVMDPARVPMVTKEITQLCNDHAKLVLVASDILGSMRYNATPTRAEVSDIANSTMDGVDGVILSEDLARGQYAARGLDLAKKIIEDIEGQVSYHELNWRKHGPIINHTLAAVTFSAYRTAHRNKAKAIVCLTHKGNTALFLASFRSSIPIFAVTMAEEVLRRLRLIRGVYGIHLPEVPGIDEVLPHINDRILRGTWLRSGDKIVMVSVSLSSVGETASNLFTVQTLK
jgi:pyruvate kinase